MKDLASDFRVFLKFFGWDFIRAFCCCPKTGFGLICLWAAGLFRDIYKLGLKEEP
jgi:hypothetical protein